jgi:hypothetical protein
MGACKAPTKPRLAFRCRPAVDVADANATAGRNDIQLPNVPPMETTMTRIMLLHCAILAAVAIQSTPVFAQDAKGKSCHMEQQCHWENFKKVCVYVKVCR